jgi:hypothetical protein
MAMSIDVRRHALGLGALILGVASAGVLWYGDGETAQILAMSGLRLAMLFGLLWLALPQVVVAAAHCSTPMGLALLAAALVFAARPRAFPIVAALLAVVAVLEFLGWLKRPFEK